MPFSPSKTSTFITDFNWAGKAAYKNYNLTKGLYHLHLGIEHIRKKDVLLVYQMGKVGSTTVFKTVKSAGPDIPVYHIHDLKKDTLDRDEAYYKKIFYSKNGGSRFLPLHLWAGQFIRKKVYDRKFNKIKIITIVRDPVARNISAFFQTLQHEYNVDLNQLSGKGSRNLIKELIDIFLHQVTWHDYPLNWLDYELKDVFDIDVYSSVFPKESGYGIYSEKNTAVLLLKLETLKNTIYNAFHSFLDIGDFKISNANIASHKSYYKAYRSFIDQIVLPTFYIEKMYSSKYVQHFYTAEEIAAFINKWSKTTRI